MGVFSYLLRIGDGSHQWN